MKEEFIFKGDEVNTLEDVIKKIVARYDQQIWQEINKGFNISLARDGERPFLIGADQLFKIKLGTNNSLSFFYPFTGG